MSENEYNIKDTQIFASIIEDQLHLSEGEESSVNLGSLLQFFLKKNNNKLKSTIFT